MISSPEPPSRRVAWNPADYAANSSSQHAWARELIARLKLRGHECILDVGFGDGKVTAELARAVPKGSATGIDSSPEMISFARETFPTSVYSNLQFEVMDARQLRFAELFDLVFSNAALHWVDDHRAFLLGVADCLRPGGRLLVSCGGKGNAQDVFVALRGAMRLKCWRGFFRQLERSYFFHRAEDYEKWLPRCRLESRGVRLADKDMAFESRENFAGWFRTTWLPYTQHVPDSQREAFIAAMMERYLARHPMDAAGRVHVHMVRLEIDAVRV